MMIVDKKAATLPEWSETEARNTTNRLEIFRIKDGFYHLRTVMEPSSTYNLLEEMIEDYAGKEGIFLFGIGTSSEGRLCGLVKTGRIVRVLKNEEGIFVQDQEGNVFCIEQCG